MRLSVTVLLETPLHSFHNPLSLYVCVYEGMYVCMYVL